MAAHEGQGYAEWLTAHGVTCYVLKYRLGPAGYRHPAMLHDAARSLQRLAKVLTFMGVADLHLGQAGPGDTVAKVRRDLLAQPGGIDQLAGEAATRQALHGPLHERLAAHGQQGLGDCVGQRAHALAPACGQDHGLGEWFGAERGGWRWGGK